MLLYHLPYPTPIDCTFLQRQVIFWLANDPPFSWNYSQELQNIQPKDFYIATPSEYIQNRKNYARVMCSLLCGSEPITHSQYQKEKNSMNSTQAKISDQNYIQRFKKEHPCCLKVTHTAELFLRYIKFKEPCFEEYLNARDEVKNCMVKHQIPFNPTKVD
eukprot:gb/GECH01001029.1/.p1 GENE.gb/GECH01001029.1/~~gb/GECH01001029.1/.p1  ORF type:complete len:160 (+),score=26.07 gb/GECH01001029.1/:1-480(+)